jgi:glucosamine-6-phosphate deaminase
LCDFFDIAAVRRRFPGISPEFSPQATLPSMHAFERSRVAIIADTSQAYDREIVAGAAQYVRETSDWELYFEEHARDRLPDFATWHGAGAIVAAGDAAIAPQIRAAGIPVVVVGGTPTDDDLRADIPRVTTDNSRIAALAAEHLLDRGLGSFGFYAPPATAGIAWPALRRRAFVERLAAAGRECAVLTATHSASNWSQLQEELTDWLTSQPRPLGVMACDDRHARHLLEACRTAGLRVPHDVAVIGVDDDELICELSTPPLTSIAQSTRRIGYEAARLLDRLMQPTIPGEPTSPIHTVIPPLRVVTRGSTDTVAVDDPLIAWAVATIRERACRGLNAQELAKLAGVSRWMIERRFRSLIGHSIHDDIARLRLAEAERLVRTTQLPMREVAARSGFHSVSYLTTAFRRKIGTTPALLRHLEQGRLATTSPEPAGTATSPESHSMSSNPVTPPDSAAIPALGVDLFERLRVSLHANRHELGAAAGGDIAACLRRLLSNGGGVRMIFAAAPSQDATLAALAAAEGIDWSRITAFHMDEYIGLPAASTQRFAAYLDRQLFDRVRPGAVHRIDTTANAVNECRRYGLLVTAAPIDIVCLGIGENGHLAFNDPPDANFTDPDPMRVVTLARVSRQQQVHDGCFGSLEEVPRQAVTLTIPTLLSGRHLFCSVPGETKRTAVERTLRGPITLACPASILRTHPECTLYVDAESFPNC